VIECYYPLVELEEVDLVRPVCDVPLVRNKVIVHGVFYLMSVERRNSVDVVTGR
jgi:hypothetical protein